METLDLLYKTFTNLEKNYKRSKKSRSEFILSKFGGDINVGSFLILNALANMEFVESEDIIKLSKVREVIGYIQENQDKLDKLSTFNFGEDDNQDALLTALDNARLAGTGIRVMRQQELYRSTKGAYHFKISPDSTLLASLANCTYYSIYNNSILKFVEPYCKNKIKVGDFVERKNLGNEFFKIKEIPFK